jgi:hypothetical protein
VSAGAKIESSDDESGSLSLIGGILAVLREGAWLAFVTGNGGGAFAPRETAAGLRKGGGVTPVAAGEEAGIAGGGVGLGVGKAGGVAGAGLGVALGVAGGVALLDGTSVAFATGTGVGVATGSGVAGLPERVMKTGFDVLGGNLTKVVALARETGCDGGRAGATCFGGNGGGPLTMPVEVVGTTLGGAVTIGSGVVVATEVGTITGVEAGGVTPGIVCVPAGGGLATDESITTTLLAPALFATGSCRVGAFGRPTVPLVGSGGIEPLLDSDSGGLSAIILGREVTAENGKGKAGSVGRGGQVIRRAEAVRRLAQIEAGQCRHGTPLLRKL